MKKNLFYYLFAVICSVTLFTSCSDDDDEKMVNPVPQTTFTGENGLQLTYNGAPMPGKKVTFTPVMGSGRKFAAKDGAQGKVSFELNDKNSFALYQYEVKP